MKLWNDHEGIGHAGLALFFCLLMIGCQAPFHTDLYAAAAQRLATNTPASGVFYTVTYGGNGSTGGQVPTDSHSYSSGALVTVLDNSEAQSNSGTLINGTDWFGGWNTQAGGGGTSYQPGSSFAITSSVTLFAVWSSPPSGTTLSGTTLTGTYTGPAVVVIPNGVTDFGTVFRNNTTITSVTMPSSVTNIGTAAFAITGLTSVIIPSSVIYVGTSAFYQNTSLTSVTIGSSVTTIGPDAFEYDTGLTSVTIPSSVISLQSAAFAGATGLTSVTIQSATTPLILFGGTNANALVFAPSSFSSTAVASGNLTLGVPIALVSAYQTYFSGVAGVTIVGQ